MLRITNVTFLTAKRLISLNKLLCEKCTKAYSAARLTENFNENHTPHYFADIIFNRYLNLLNFKTAPNSINFNRKLLGTDENKLKLIMNSWAGKLERHTEKRTIFQFCKLQTRLPRLAVFPKLSITCHVHFSRIILYTSRRRIKIQVETSHATR